MVDLNRFEQIQIDGNNGKFSETPKGFGKRHIQMILCFFGMSIAFGMRTNMSVAIVAMTTISDHTADNTTNDYFEHYDWNESERGLILSSTNWGFVFTPIISGIVAKRFGPKLPLIFATGIAGCVTICVSFFATFGWQYVCGLRFLQGLSQGFVNPCIHTIMSKWLHPNERYFASIVYSGGVIGIIITLLLSGVIASSSIFGWPAIFYFSGGCGIIWTIFFIVFGSNSPADYKTISVVEREFIESMPGSNTTNKKTTIPWNRIFRSKPCWTLFIVQGLETWGYITLLSTIPSYIDGILHFDIKSNAVFSTLPYIAMMIVISVSSKVSNILVSRDYLSNENGRKWFNSIGVFGPMVCLLILGNINNNVYTAVILLVLAVSTNGCVYSGYYINHIDLTPNFAGALMGVGQTFGTFMGILGPMFVGFVVTDAHDPSLWNIAFCTTAAMYCAAGLLFIFFGSGQIQEWNDIKR